MTVPTSANLRIILEGIDPPEGNAGRLMPGFANELSDGQVRDLVAYIREYFGRAPAWHDIEDEVRKSRKELSERNGKTKG